jgi:NADH dehydrogenase
VREASLLARNIVASVAGSPTSPLTFHPRGAFASLGGRRAVAEIYGIRLSGTLAWVVWRLVYVGMLPAWSTRIRVALEQVLDLFLPRSIVRTQTEGAAASRFVRQRAGDIVMSPGQLGDGVHLVIEGSYEQVVSGGQGRIFLPGDTFGDDEIAAGQPHEQFIRAREASRCFILSREEYKRIHSAMQQARQRAVTEEGPSKSAKRSLA